MKGWMSTCETGNQAPLFTEQMVQCNSPYWAPFCCPSVLAVTAWGVSTSICMPALSIGAATNMVVVGFFSLTHFSRFSLKPVAGTGWEWAAARKRGRWATLHHRLCQTHCKLNPQPKHGLDSSGKINVENRDNEVTWIKLGHTCLTMQVGY